MQAGKCAVLATFAILCAPLVALAQEPDFPGCPAGTNERRGFGNQEERFCLDAAGRKQGPRWAPSSDGTMLETEKYRDNVLEGVARLYQGHQLIRERHYSAGKEVPPRSGWTAGRKTYEWVQDGDGTVARSWTPEGVLEKEVTRDSRGEKTRERKWSPLGVPMSDTEYCGKSRVCHARTYWGKGQLRKETARDVSGKLSSKEYGADGRLIRENAKFVYAYRDTLLYSAQSISTEELTAAIFAPLACPPGAQLRALGIDAHEYGKISGEACVEENGQLHGPLRAHGHRDGWFERGAGKLEHYQHGALHGRSIEWDASGQVRSVRTYYGGLAEGPSVEWYANGAPSAAGRYENDQKTGTWLLYEETGLLRERVPYLDGKKTGNRMEFAYDGSLAEFEQLVDGERHGLRVVWREDGAPSREETYRAGKLDGVSRWFSHGRLSSEHAYVADIHVSERDFGETLVVTQEIEFGKDHQPTVRVTYYPSGNRRRVSVPRAIDRATVDERSYFESGGVESTGTVKGHDREPIGDWRWFYESGQLARTGHYHYGHRVGDWREYHENGQLASEGQHGSGCKRKVPYQTLLPDGQPHSLTTRDGECPVGEWRFYAEDGRLLGTLDYGTPVEVRETPHELTPGNRGMERGSGSSY